MDIERYKDIPSSIKQRLIGFMIVDLIFLMMQLFLVDAIFLTFLRPFSLIYCISGATLLTLEFHTSNFTLIRKFRIFTCIPLIIFGVLTAVKGDPT